MDNNGVDQEPVKISMTVTVKGSDLLIDLSGSAPQQNGPINCPLPGAISACRYAVKALTVPKAPPNEGHFRPLKVTATPRTLFNPVPPAPTFLYFCTALRLVDLIPLALAEAIPEKVPASSGSDVSVILMYFLDHESGRGETVGGAEPIGMGALRDADGQNALVHHSEGGCRSIPVEVIESRAPMLVERFELRRDSGGPGKHRGGLGVRKDYRTLSNGLAISLIERITGPEPPGLHGGNPGRRGTVVFYPGTDREERGGRMKREMSPRDVASIETHGGGGYGDPFQRDPKAVLEDVRNGYVSPEAAQRDYGVVVHTANWTIDSKATARLRNELREARPA